LALSNAAKAGVAIFVGAVQFGISVILSEVYYSAYGSIPYSISGNYLSDLGATCATGIQCYIPPSANIFNYSLVLLGILVLVSAYYIQRAAHWKPATALLALTGIGALGSGLFPESTGILHGISQLIAFLFAGLSAVVLARFQRKPMFYFSIILGLTTLAALVLRAGGIDLGLGYGGIERMILYPVLLWGAGFGGHLMASEDILRP